MDKTINRPRKSKGKSDLIIFTKWDQFSRNDGDAYQMISQLRSVGVEPLITEKAKPIMKGKHQNSKRVYLKYHKTITISKA